MSDGLSGWQEYHLNEIYTFASGLSKSRDQFGFGFPFLSFKDVFNNFFLPKKLGNLANTSIKERLQCSIKKGDVFLTRTSETQEELGMSSVALIDYPEATFNGFTKRLRPIGHIDVWPEYTGYYFRSPYFRATVTSMSSMTTRASLNNDMMSALKIMVPPLPEQKAIANILSSLDDKIDLLHRQNKTLESMAETLFRQWFLEEAQDVCEEYSVSDFADHVKENVVPAKSKSEYYHHYSLPAFDEGKRPTLELGSEILSNKYKVVEHSILVSKLNPKVPRIWPVSSLPSKNSICSTEFQVLRPKNIKLYGYLLFLLRSNDAVDALSMAASGTSGSHQRVRPEDIFNIKTSLPSLARAEQYSNMVMPGIAKTCSNLLQINILEILRDTLLPKLMSGEVTVIN